MRARGPEDADNSAEKPHKSPILPKITVLTSLSMSLLMNLRLILRPLQSAMKASLMTCRKTIRLKRPTGWAKRKGPNLMIRPGKPAEKSHDSISPNRFFLNNARSPRSGGKNQTEILLLTAPRKLQGLLVRSSGSQKNLSLRPKAKKKLLKPFDRQARLSTGLSIRRTISAALSIELSPTS